MLELSKVISVFLTITRLRSKVFSLEKTLVLNSFKKGFGFFRGGGTIPPPEAIGLSVVGLEGGGGSALKRSKNYLYAHLDVNL